MCFKGSKNVQFRFEIHHGGQFVWNLDLVYLGGGISFIDKVDLDRLSLFEIQDIYGDFGANTLKNYIIF